MQARAISIKSVGVSRSYPTLFSWAPGYACAPILMGMTSSVSEIPLPSKTAKIPFQTMDSMDYSPWSSKNLIDRNRLEKLMQVKIDELCMCTNFGGCCLSSFGDTATLKNGQISLSDHGL